MVTTNALPGRTHWQGGDQPGRQAHTLEETLRVHNTKQDKKAIYFFEMSVLFETGELNAYVYDGGGLYRRKYV